MRHATVVSKLCFDAIRFVPVFMSMKHPVPYVFFTIPGLRHACPKRAACWSPAMPAIGTGAPNSRVCAVHLARRRAPRAASQRGTPKISQQLVVPLAPSSMSNSIVRDALLTSVTCTLPPVRFHTSHESTVPNASSPAFAFALRALHVLQHPLDLGGREVRVDDEAGLATDDALELPLLQPIAELPPCADPATRSRS